MSTSPSSTNWPQNGSGSRIKARRAAQLDLSLLVVVLALTVCGLLTILSASAPAAQLELHGDPPPPTVSFVRPYGTPPDAEEGLVDDSAPAPRLDEH